MANGNNPITHLDDCCLYQEILRAVDRRARGILSLAESDFLLFHGSLCKEIFHDISELYSIFPSLMECEDNSPKVRNENRKILKEVQIMASQYKSLKDSLSPRGAQTLEDLEQAAMSPMERYAHKYSDIQCSSFLGTILGRDVYVRFVLP